MRQVDEMPCLSRATRSVEYRNRTRDTTEYRPQSLAGDYYIAVHVGEALTGHDARAPVPIQLDVTVDGAAEPGPHYAVVGPLPVAPADGPAQPAPPGAVATQTAIAPAGRAVIGGAALLIVLLAVVLVRRGQNPTVVRNVRYRQKFSAVGENGSRRPLMGVKIPTVAVMIMRTEGTR